MVDKSAERVLVVPTAVFHQAGIFQGFSPRTEHYLPRLLDPVCVSYRPRAEVETDPSFKQIVPYVVLRWGDQLFHYTRGKGATESRLRALRSIGVGGHISADDANLFESPYREAMFREVAEEAGVSTGMLNHYFANRMEMLEETCVRINDAVTDRFFRHEDYVVWSREGGL